jgi:hypothetical protein
MASAESDDRPSREEIRRRIEVALENGGVPDAAAVSALAARAVQPTIDSLKSSRDAARVGAEFYFGVVGYVRSHPPSDLRSAILTVLQDLEPWNDEWVRLAQEHA